MGCAGRFEVVFLLDDTYLSGKRITSILLRSKNKTRLDNFAQSQDKAQRRITSTRMRSSIRFTHEKLTFREKVNKAEEWCVRDARWSPYYYYYRLRLSKSAHIRLWRGWRGKEYSPRPITQAEPRRARANCPPIRRNAWNERFLLYELTRMVYIFTCEKIGVAVHERELYSQELIPYDTLWSMISIPSRPCVVPVSLYEWFAQDFHHGTTKKDYEEVFFWKLSVIIDAHSTNTSHCEEVLSDFSYACTSLALEQDWRYYSSYGLCSMVPPNRIWQEFDNHQILDVTVVTNHNIFDPSWRRQRKARSFLDFAAIILVGHRSLC